MKRRRFCFAALCIIACCCAAIGALTAALEFPALLNLPATAFGHEVAAQPLSPSLDGAIPITNIGRNALTLLAANVVALGGEIDSLDLQDLKLTFRVGDAPAGNTDFSFVEKLPNIRRLNVQNAEILILFEGKERQVTLTGVNFTLRDFSSTMSGDIAFRARFALTEGGDTALAARGTLSGTFQMAGVSPGPYGKGTVAFVLDSGTYAIGNRPVSLAGLTLTADLAYDQRTEVVEINALRVQSQALGAVEGTARAALRDAMPWHADLSAASLDLGHLFAGLKSFLPKEYAAWTVHGQGGLRAHVQGTLGSDGPALEGTVTCGLAQGAFSSPDSTKAAQGVRGSLSLKVAYVAAQHKLTFGVRAEQRDGEYLWGTYYNNLAGRRASLVADGDVYFDGERRSALRGVLDLFQTGDYSIEASGGLDAWTLHAKAVNVSHAAVVEALLKEYLKGLSPGLETLSLTGRSFLEAHVRSSGGTTTVTGAYRITGARLDVPDMRLSIREIAANVPFDLRYPVVVEQNPPSQAAGFMHLQALQRGRLSIDSLRIPVVVSQNRLEVPEPIVVPFFGGQVRLYGLQINDVLFPSRYRFGVKIDDVDLGRMTRRLTGIEYPGRINADFGMMRYENNRVESEGKAVVAIFGGEIAATNLFAENIASPSRKVGGDIVFRDISLEELTSKIAVGKMTGVIRGSLRNFIMEYGEPASFALEIESVATRSVAQSISMDAIQSISILGTGADSALNRGITQFFKEYPYSKIGIRCVLKNDQFSVNGTIRDGGKEYLVRRGLLRGVDVVNQNPDNVISFRDMAERVKRIYRTPEVEAGGITVE